MRISDTMKFRQVASNVQTGERGLQALQSQISSGKRIQKASDDPNAAAGILQARSTLRGIQQYERNIGQGVARLEAEESVLNQLGDALVRARELAVQESTATATAETRQAVKYEVDNLIRFAVSLGNTRYNDGHLFAGHQADRAPFDAADPLVPPAGVNMALVDNPHEIEVSAGQRVPTNHNGQEVFLDSGALASLVNFSNALGADDVEGIRSALSDLTASSRNVDDLLADVGGRFNHLLVVEKNLKVLDLSTTELQGELEDVDMAKALVDLSARTTAVQSAYMATSRIMSLNLSDYLR